MAWLADYGWLVLPTAMVAWALIEVASTVRQNRRLRDW